MKSDEPGTAPSEAWTSPEMERIGRTLGPYRLLRPLGSGGMATVFEARHTGLEKRVAVKVLRERLVVDGDIRRRFVREGILASRVRHPNVVDVTDVGEDRGHAFLVMELLEGESLAARMHRKGPMQVERVLEMLLPIIAALAEAHRAGVVHRDVKPENIFIARAGDRREVSKLLDFGISGVSSLLHDRITDDYKLLGTAHYMAPEQARGGLVDGRADQYALAVVIFEALTGRLPYVADGANLFELIAEVARGAPLRLTACLPSAPQDLSDVLAKALSGSRDARHEKIEELGGQLLRFASSRAVRRFRELVDPEWSSMSIAQQTSAAQIDASGAVDLLRLETPTLGESVDLDPGIAAGRASGAARTVLAVSAVLIVFFSILAMSAAGLARGETPVSHPSAPATTEPSLP